MRTELLRGGIIAASCPAAFGRLGDVKCRIQKTVDPKTCTVPVKSAVFIIRYVNYDGDVKGRKCLL